MANVLPDTRASGASPPPSPGYKVDISRGERIGRVSSEWFSRPDDERFLSLGALHTAVRARAERATARTVETKALRVEASRDDAERLALIVPGGLLSHRGELVKTLKADDGRIELRAVTGPD